MPAVFIAALTFINLNERWVNCWAGVGCIVLDSCGEWKMDSRELGWQGTIIVVVQFATQLFINRSIIKNKNQLR